MDRKKTGPSEANRRVVKTLTEATEEEGRRSKVFYDVEMRPLKTMQVTLVFGKPVGATRASVLKYLKEELACAGGCRYPEDPLFHGLSVTCTKVEVSD